MIPLKVHAPERMVNSSRWDFLIYKNFSRPWDAAYDIAGKKRASCGARVIEAILLAARYSVVRGVTSMRVQPLGQHFSQVIPESLLALLGAVQDLQKTDICARNRAGKSDFDRAAGVADCASGGRGAGPGAGRAVKETLSSNSLKSRLFNRIFEGKSGLNCSQLQKIRGTQEPSLFHHHSHGI